MALVTFTRLMLVGSFLYLQGDCRCCESWNLWHSLVSTTIASPHHHDDHHHEHDTPTSDLGHAMTPVDCDPVAPTWTIDELSMIGWSCPPVGVLALQESPSARSLTLPGREDDFPRALPLRAQLQSFLL
ncbi:hypothetical protein [Planctomycetes bacterium Pan216]|uniref:hypothetical protein n=1 Tax=Kolteria novifilia TaxID=2527975 RepID=UPI0011A22284